MRIIISGGGTGGHIFPAVSIAGKLKELNPDNEILFVGAEGKMEMEKVPAAGFKIVGLPIIGLQRQLSLQNLIGAIKVPFKVLESIRRAKRIIREFKPNIAIGVGGYASAPLLWAATSMGIPSLIQEQNGFAGLTNKILGKRVAKICVAYEGMERFFPAEKIILTGNPIREAVSFPPTEAMKKEATEFYGLNPALRHIFIVGGSLGSGTLNRSMRQWISLGCPGGEGVEIIWQCGKYYKEGVDAFMAERKASGMDISRIHHYDFIARMDLAYAAADLVISRSGASTVSELCAVGKPVIFVPSPNVAEDHQTHNAMALVRKEAAEIVKDADAPEALLPKALELLGDPARLESMHRNISALALTDAAKTIADEAYAVAGKAVKPGKVYFIGIGGIGMSALAKYFSQKGYEVSGYDRTPSPITESLEKAGIPVHFEDEPDKVPSDALVIYTPAVPDDFGELVKARSTGQKVVKRSRALGEICRGQRCLAVAGTHGKTTTSTLTAHMLTESGVGCSAFLGGISKNYGTNLLVSQNDIVVAEADEFDRSFLQLHPEVAVITAVSADHLDIYGDLEHVVEAFKAFASQVTGTLIVKKGTPLTAEDTPAKFLRYHLDDPEADFYGSDFRTDELGHSIFNLHHSGGVIENVRVGVPGAVYAENTIAAAAICLTCGVDPEKIKAAAASFSGAQRRMDVHLNTPSLTYIDDYAHHPEEIAATLSSIRGMFPGRKITAVFQPHLYTRTRDFAPEFAEALSKADSLVLIPIYPAREEPIEGVTSEIIFKDVTCPEKILVPKDKLLETLKGMPLDVIVTFGAGDIDRFTGPITEMLSAR